MTLSFSALLPLLRRAMAISAHLVFWGYNAVFIALLYFGLIPLELGHLVDDVQRGSVPVTMIGILLVGAAVPLACTVFALIKVRRRPRALLALFFGVEAPVLLVTLFLGVFHRSLTPAVTMLLVGFFAGALAQAIQSLRRAGDQAPPTPRNTAGQLALLMLNAMGLVCGLYLAGLLLFFVPPWAQGVIAVLQDDGLYRELYRALTQLRAIHLLGLLLGLGSAVLVAGVPIGLVTLPVTRGYRGCVLMARQGGLAAALLTVGFTMAGCVLALVFSTKQPQRMAFEATDSAPTTHQDRLRWLSESDDIRQGLIQTYLKRHLYLGTDRGLHVIEHLYTEVGFEHATAQHVQGAFNSWARPFIFDDHSRAMSEAEALKRYQAYFDAPLTADAAEAVQDALRNNRPLLSHGAAGRRDEGMSRVHRIAQHIRVRPDGSSATIEVQDAYQSQIQQDSEVWLSFELPPTAALTGLWMGPSPNRAEAFPFTVSPRGAARRVYEAQVRRRIDPALLEQVGPRQFRLRIFPIPGKDGAEAAPIVYVWTQYQALPGPDGWPSPRLLKARNVIFPDSAVRTIDAQPSSHASWTPARIAAAPTQPRRAWRHEVGPGLSIFATPLSDEQPQLPAGRRFGVIIDRSLSMASVRDQVQDTLHALQRRLGPYNQVDVLLTSAPTRGEPPAVLPLGEVDATQLLMFGGQGVQVLFEQAQALLRGRDGLIIITDGADSGLNAAPNTVLATDAPIFILALNGAPPSVPDALTKTVLASGGDTLTNVSQLWAALAGAAHPPSLPDIGSDVGLVGVADGWAFLLGPSPERSPLAPQPEGAAIAASWFIRAHTQAQSQPSVATLDRLHNLARETPVVTPYSSMIVLVNDAQREQLRRASRQADRFKRHDTDNEAPLAHPLSLDGNLSGAPEPGTWALLMLAGAGLSARRRRRGLSGSP